MASTDLGKVGSAPSKAPGGTVQKLRVQGAFAFIGAGTFADDRGSYEEIEIMSSEEPVVLQSGYSRSRENVLRGIHCSTYGKIVVCQNGEIWDVVVDLRPESPTYLQWDAVVLSPERRMRIFVPPNCGHGFVALKPDTICLYLKTGKYNKDQEIEVNPFDPKIAVQWPAPVGGAKDYIISKKDASLPLVDESLRKRAGWMETRSKL